MLVAYHHLYMQVIIGNALDVSRILPIGVALFIQGASTQYEPCSCTFPINITAIQYL